MSADGKVCVNNANKYASHFLRFSLGDDGQDERSAEYDALNEGDSSKLPDADPARAGYRLGVADKPATDAMEESGQFQRLGLALLLFVGELGAILLLGSLAVGIVLAQVLLLLLLAFAPVALVAAAIPGRGHAFFKGWLEKLAGYLLRKAAYSLILATLLAVSGALASASAQLGWLMSVGLQSLFFWTVFIQRRSLVESLIGIATGPAAPGREATVRLLAIYAGARMGGRVARPLRRGTRSAARASGRLAGGRFSSRGSTPGDAKPTETPRSDFTRDAPVGATPGTAAPVRAEKTEAAERQTEPSRKPRSRPAQASASSSAPAGDPVTRGADKRSGSNRLKPERKAADKAAEGKPAGERRARQQPKQRSTEPVRKQPPRDSAGSLGEELRDERERLEEKRPSDARLPRNEESAPPRLGARKGGRK